MLLRLIVLGFLVTGIVPVNAQPSSPPPLRCESGPANRTFGGTNWLVYSCDDRASMVVVAAQGNPASPFYFFLTPDGGTYRIRGEGTGDKKASDAAFDALSKMTPADFGALLAATNPQSSPGR